MAKYGISIIVCCYNSEWIIKRCLESLISQKIPKSILWEIIIVNNASTDNTEKIAKEILEKSSINYAIIEEKQQGLLSARKCGVNKAQYSYIIFCDDDNLLCENYVYGMYTIMNANKFIGAFGGRGIAEFESNPESLIDSNLASYAIGSQKNYRNRLYGAGVCVRKDCAIKIYKRHRFMLTGRCGDNLLAGDDSELIKAIILQGYKIGCTDDLTFIHVLPSKRTSNNYLCDLHKGFGLSAPVLYIYDLCI